MHSHVRIEVRESRGRYAGHVRPRVGSTWHDIRLFSSSSGRRSRAALIHEGRFPAKKSPTGGIRRSGLRRNGIRGESCAAVEIRRCWLHPGTIRDWRRRGESNPRIKVLQTLALPLGYSAVRVERGTWVGWTDRGVNHGDARRRKKITGKGRMGGTARSCGAAAFRCGDDQRLGGAG